MKIHGLIGMILTSLLLGGCASVAAFKGVALDEECLYVSGLTPVMQNKQYSCGAACVAAVAVFWNVPLSGFRAKHPQVSANLTGLDLQMQAEELGLQAFAYRGSMDDLQENLRKGRPVIVMILQPLVPTGDLMSGLLLTAWDKFGVRHSHWVVVIGVTKNQSMIIHDPLSGPIVIKREAFKAWWAHEDNLTVLLAAR